MNYLPIVALVICFLTPILYDRFYGPRWRQRKYGPFANEMERWGCPQGAKLMRDFIKHGGSYAGQAALSQSLIEMLGQAWEREQELLRQVKTGEPHPRCDCNRCRERRAAIEGT